MLSTNWALAYFQRWDFRDVNTVPYHLRWEHYCAASAKCRAWITKQVGQPIEPVQSEQKLDVGTSHEEADDY